MDMDSGLSTKRRLSDSHLRHKKPGNPIKQVLPNHLIGAVFENLNLKAHYFKIFDVGRQPPRPHSKIWSFLLDLLLQKEELYALYE